LGIKYKNKIVQSSIQVINTNNRYTQALLFTANKVRLLLVNVYMPCNTPENDECLTECIANVTSLWNSVDCDSIVLAGDFNLDPKIKKFNELRVNCSEEELRILDLDLPPNSTHTYVSNQTGHSSWLDHIIVSNDVLCKHIFVSDEILSSDHLMLVVNIHFNHNYHNSINQSDVCCDPKVRWNKLSHTNCELYKKSTIVDFSILDKNAFACRDPKCNNVTHLNTLNDVYNFCVSKLKNAERSVCRKTGMKRKLHIEGWNSSVKELHKKYRNYYLLWVASGKVRNSNLYILMSRSRSDFKKALRKAVRM